jgi:hypothetical protein
VEFDARTARERNLTPGRQFSVGQTATHVWQIATQLSALVIEDLENPQFRRKGFCR